MGLQFDSAIREKHPEVFAENTHEDPRSRTRTVPMQVLNLGLPRTGTVSMTKAYDILGIPCWHSYQTWPAINDNWMWQEALNAKLYNCGTPFTRLDWDQLIGHFGAITDSPACFFGEELMAAYPEAKVVLVERDLDKWVKSFIDGVMTPSYNPEMEQLRRTERTLIGPVGDTQIMGHHGLMDIHSFAEAAEKARNFYLDWYAHIKAITPPEKLLLFRLEEGWEPLCKFLDKEVPDVAFPHLHESEVLQEKMALLMEVGKTKDQVVVDEHRDPWVCPKCRMSTFDKELGPM